MQIDRFAIEGPLLLTPRVFSDERGFFQESWNERDFNAALGQDVHFVQDNHSRSVQGVLRGMHYQLSRPQGKLVRVVAGRVFDVLAAALELVLNGGRRHLLALDLQLGYPLPADGLHHGRMRLATGFYPAHGLLLHGRARDEACALHERLEVFEGRRGPIGADAKCDEVLEHRRVPLQCLGRKTPGERAGLVQASNALCLFRYGRTHSPGCGRLRARRGGSAQVGSGGDSACGRMQHQHGSA